MYPMLFLAYWVKDVTDGVVVVRPLDLTRQGYKVASLHLEEGG